MSYKHTKNLLLAFLLCFLAAAPCFAQNNTQAMRLILVNNMMEYGQTLYERGDLNEASAVFNHVLLYDRHQPQALQYLKEMGQGPNFDDDVLKAFDASDTGSLEKAIEAKKKSIEILRAQIAKIQANLAVESARE